MNIIKKALAGVFALGMASTASAALIYDYQKPGVILENGESHTVTHDLTDDGVPDDYSVTDAWLILSFSDGKIFEDLAFDTAELSGPGLSGEFEVDGTHLFGFDIKFFGVGDDGIDSLNLNGLLEVTITALDNGKKWVDNDFWWKESLLKAKIAEVPVPEPGTLALLGLGLAGLGVSRRRSAA